MKQRWIAAAAALVAVPAVTLGNGLTADASPAHYADYDHGSGNGADSRTATPIKHLVVLFDENVSFDHYFATYPVAANTDGSKFRASSGTPTVNGLTQELLTSNPNSAQPQRLTPAQAVTCSQNHGYTAEQEAFDNGLMDKFVERTQSATCTSTGAYQSPGLVMDYYDGNTVTGLWNYAQNYALSDNSYDTNFGPSTVGAINLISGQTHGATVGTTTTTTPNNGNSVQNGTVIGDPDPTLDDCGAAVTNNSTTTTSMTGTNIGDLLNKQNVTWGWFQGGFKPTSTVGGTAVCGASHTNIAGASSPDYSPHHEPFMYYPQTANQHHLPPTSVSMIGKSDQAKHQYDLSDFWTSVDHGNMPAVSFLKAAEYQDGHPGYSDPIDEQHFLVDTINRLQKSSDWKSTAVVIAYDDSDGWYDHQMSPIVEKSQSGQDSLTGAQTPAYGPAGTTANPNPLNPTNTTPATPSGSCGVMRTSANSGGSTNLDAYQDRCGYGPRLPMLVISPYSKKNYVDHTTTDQTSILKFVEDNWLGGNRIGNDSFDAIAGPITNMLDFSSHPDNGNSTLFLDPKTGQPTHR